MAEVGFTDEVVRTAWNEGATAWHEFVESGADYYRTEVHGPALLAACAPCDGARALDLGCGQGYFSRQLARAGASVVGVDIADELLRIARGGKSNAPLGIEYHEMHAASVDQHWAAHSFDLVTGCMSLHDMADPRAALTSARRVLGRTGRMVFSVPHPCTDTPFREWTHDGRHRKVALQIDRYFESGALSMHWNMPRLLYSWTTPYWHRTLTEWSDWIADTGFRIERLLEPRPTAEQLARNADLEDCARVPYFLVFALSVKAPPL